ncbi:MAG: amidohydrolase family protein, partial [Planctomycetota bacterium]
MTRFFAWTCLLVLSACSLHEGDAADLVLVNARVYSLDWAEPSLDGRPAADAPYGAGGWAPDATAVAVRGDRIIYVGSDSEALAFSDANTRIRNLAGATVLPGLIESHTHAVELGRNLRMADLVGVGSEDEAIARVRVHARKHPQARWLLGHGWDEGAWADRYPDMAKLSRAFPNRPVVLRGLHGFAIWGNAAAFAAAGIDRDTQAPTGGEIIRDATGNPSGVLTNRATELLNQAIPSPTQEEREAAILAGLETLAR